jgi:hypothetical protein
MDTCIKVHKYRAPPPALASAALAFAATAVAKGRRRRRRRWRWPLRRRRRRRRWHRCKALAEETVAWFGRHGYCQDPGREDRAGTGPGEWGLAVLSLGLTEYIRQVPAALDPDIRLFQI